MSEDPGGERSRTPWQAETRSAVNSRPKARWFRSRSTTGSRLASLREDPRHRRIDGHSRSSFTFLSGTHSSSAAPRPEPADAIDPGIHRGAPTGPGLIPPMTVHENEQALVDELALLPDPHERLAHLIHRAGRRAPLALDERTETTLVPGCVSRVWLAASLQSGRCHFRVAADSPMVLGLMSLLCDVYEGAPPSEVASVEPTVLTRSALDRALSPTRLRGLAHAQARLQQLAASLATEAG